VPYPTPSAVIPGRPVNRTGSLLPQNGSVAGPPASTRTAKLKERLDAARSNSARLGNLVRRRQKQIDDLNAEIAELQKTNQGGAKQSQIDSLKIRIGRLEPALEQLKRDKKAADKLVRDLQADIIKSREKDREVANPPVSLTEDKSAKMNLSACKELYFRGNESFMFGLNGTKDISANAPGSPAEWRTYLADASYKNAEKLWSAGVATKGRIQTFIPPSSAKGDNNSRTPSSSAKGASTFARGRKMFQFHYNPGSVGVSYGSVSDIDLGTVVAQGSALTNVYSALGQVQFELLINRMPDMKFIKPEGNFKKEGVDYLQIYDRTPITDAGRPNELEAIYNKGTMYDIEFLLKILMGGVAYRSWLRGGTDLTSDIGFVVPQPVELHLGNRLRYVVSMTGLSLKHVIFNERMVPLFTTLSITANRLPADAIGTSSTDLTKLPSTGGN